MIIYKLLYFIILIFFLQSCTFIIKKPKKEPNWRFAPQMYDSIPYNHDALLQNRISQIAPKNTLDIEKCHFTEEDSYLNFSTIGIKYIENPIINNDFNYNEGKKLYISMCSHCHGKYGFSDAAMIINESYPIIPPKFNDNTNIRQHANIPIAQYTPGMLYHVITHGYGMMGSHKSIITPEERWQIILYVQKLQRM